MPILQCYVSDDNLRFLREEAERRSTNPEWLAEAAIENAICEARRSQPTRGSETPPYARDSYLNPERGSGVG